MSINFTAYLMIGVKINRKEYKVDIFSNEWLPLLEGHVDEPMRLIISEGDNNIYIGKVIASMDRNDEGYFVDYVPDSNDFVEVDGFLWKKLAWTGESAKLMFFGSWG